MSLKKISIKLKLIIVGLTFIIGIGISFFGIVQILKVTKLKSLVREHMDYMVFFIQKSDKLIDLIDDNRLEKAREIINSDSFVMEEMGTLKLIKTIRGITTKARDSVNLFEEYLFRIFGFGRAFDLIYEDIENCKKLGSVFLKIEEKKYENIEKEMLFLIKYLNEVEDKEDEFELIVMEANEFVQKLIFILLSSISLSSLIILFYLSKSILYSINNFQNGLIDFFSYLNYQKDNFKAIEVNSNDEFKEMSEIINRHIKFTAKVIENNVSIIERVADGDYSVKMEIRGENDIFAKSINKMIDKLKYTKEFNNEQNWLKDGISKLNSRLSGNLNVVDLNSNAIAFLCEYLEGLMGVIYIKKGKVLELSGKYAFLQMRGLFDKYEIGEGVIGQVATQKIPILLQNINGKDINTYTYPLIYEDKLYGVLEVASSKEFNKLYLEFLNTSSQIIATYLFVAIQNEKINLLKGEK